MSNEKNTSNKAKRKRAAQQQQRPKRKQYADDRTPFVKKVDKVCKVLAVILAIMFFANAHVLFRGGGYDDTTIVPVFGFASSTTDSAVMEPEIEAKSALFTKSKDSYEVGDIVQYFDGEYNPVRRVTEVSADGQTYTVVGDNEPSSDAVEVKAEDISGAVFWSSTFLYGFIDFYVTALGAAITVLLSFIMLMMSDFLMFRKRKAELMAKREAQEKKEALKLKVRQGIEDPEAQAQEDLSPIEKRKAEKQAKLEKERAEIAAEMKQLQKKMKAEEAELQQKESGKRGKKK